MNTEIMVALIAALGGLAGALETEVEVQGEKIEEINRRMK